MEEPFDARRVMLIDATEPGCGNWRLVSLISALRAAVQPPDVEVDGQEVMRNRLGAYDEIVEELTNRGIDGESLVRYGLAAEITGTVIALVLPAWLAGPDAPIQAQSDRVAAHRSAWIKFLSPYLPEPTLPTLETPLSESVDTVRQATIQAAVALASWVMTAPVGDLLTLRPPERGTTAEEPEYVPDHELLQDYMWLAERFSITHLSDWAFSSLQREYLWLHDRKTAPCNETLMEDRRVPEADLQAELAARAVAGSDYPTLGASYSVPLAARMQRQATDLLKSHRIQEAVALFEFAATENPRDALAANNLGFCLIPLDASSALRHLIQGSQLGYNSTGINLYNQALAHYRTENLGRVLEIVSSCEQLPPSELRAVGTLWILTETNELKLDEKAYVGRSLASLGSRVARHMGRLELAARWDSLDQFNWGPKPTEA